MLTTWGPPHYTDKLISHLQFHFLYYCVELSFWRGRLKYISITVVNLIETVSLLADLAETTWVPKELNPSHSSRSCPWRAIDHSRELCGRLCQWAVFPRRWMPLSCPAAQSHRQRRHVSPRAPPRGCSGCAGPARAGGYSYWNGHRWKSSRDGGNVSMLT